MHLLLPADDSLEHLQDELRRSLPGCALTVRDGLVAWEPAFPGRRASPPNSERQPDAAMTESLGAGHAPEHPEPPRIVVEPRRDLAAAPPPLVFARQFLPDAQPVEAASIRGLADLLFEAAITRLPEGQPWRLHLAPAYGVEAATAGRNRCQLIREALRERLQRQRRQRLRQLAEPGVTTPFATAESLLQLVLLRPDFGYLSAAPAPLPQQLRQCLSPFPLGHVPVASDKSAPCRAFAKLVEAEARQGRTIAPGETCVDLGACPGSWSYVALARGARVTAVDRSALRPDLMANPNLTFHRGDAFAFAPTGPVDWLLCDVIATPDRSIGLLLDWLRRRLCRRFVVTIKFKGTADYPALDRLKEELPRLSDDFLLTRLCANKNEACAMGRARRPEPHGVESKH